MGVIGSRRLAEMKVHLLQSICYKYRSHLKWLIPLPGDWHVLYNNYHKALMKG